MHNRAHRIKCDESPGSCQNCIETRTVCKGYDLHWIPTARGRYQRSESRTVVVKYDATLAAKLLWKATSGEARCLTYFQQQTAPQLVTFFDSPVWDRLVLQLCYVESAVFHAVIALGVPAQAQEMAKEGINNVNSKRGTAAKTMVTLRIGAVRTLVCVADQEPCVGESPVASNYSRLLSLVCYRRTFTQKLRHNAVSY